MSKPLARDSTSCKATMSAPISASTRAMRSGAKRRSMPIAPCALYETMTALLRMRPGSRVRADTAQAPVDDHDNAGDGDADEAEQGPGPRTRLHERGDQAIDQKRVERDAGQHAECRTDQVRNARDMRRAGDQV